MSTDELELLKKHVGEAFRGNNKLLGVYTAICKTSDLEKRLLQREGVYSYQRSEAYTRGTETQDRSARSRAQQVAVATVKKLHLLSACVRDSRDALQDLQLPWYVTRFSF